MELAACVRLVNHTGQAVETYRYGPYGEVEAFPSDLPSIGSTVQVRLRADQNVFKDSNNKVSQWGSGGLQAIAPANTAEQPTFVENTIPNGRPAIRFDGSFNGVCGRDAERTVGTVFSFRFDGEDLIAGRSGTRMKPLR